MCARQVQCQFLTFEAHPVLPDQCLTMRRKQKLLRPTKQVFLPKQFRSCQGQKRSQPSPRFSVSSLILSPFLKQNPSLSLWERDHKKQLIVRSEEHTSELQSQFHL